MLLGFSVEAMFKKILQNELWYSVDVTAKIN